MVTETEMYFFVQSKDTIREKFSGIVVEQISCQRNWMMTKPAGINMETMHILYDSLVYIYTLSNILH